MMVQDRLGNVNAKRIHKKLLDDPLFADKLMELLDNSGSEPVEQLSRVEALSFLIHHDWSENDYRYVFKMLL